MKDKHQHGGDVYSHQVWADFSANINPLGPPEGVKRALTDCLSGITHYPDVQCRRLREALAKREGVRGEYLIFGNGAAELIYALALGLRPKKALLAVPGFAEYEEALRAAGCRCAYYNRRNRFQIGEDYLEQITEELDLLFLCNPNNPTGDLLDKGFLKRVLDRCAQKQVLAVVDECFLGFLERPEDYSVKEYLEDYPGLFLLSAFTKLYAMPGLRLGYGICSSPKILEQISRVLQPWNISLPAQEAGLAALPEEEYVNRTRRLVGQERRYLERGLENLGFTVWPGTVNYLFFQGPAGLAADCRKKGFLIRDCENYRGLEAGYYRIAVRTREENEALLQAMKKIMEEKEETQDGKGNYGAGDHVQCGKESDLRRPVQNL